MLNLLKIKLEMKRIQHKIRPSSDFIANFEYTKQFNCELNQHIFLLAVTSPSQMSFINLYNCVWLLYFSWKKITPNVKLKHKKVSRTSCGNYEYLFSGADGFNLLHVLHHLIVLSCCSIVLKAMKFQICFNTAINHNNTIEFFRTQMQAGNLLFLKLIYFF